MEYRTVTYRISELRTTAIIMLVVGLVVSMIGSVLRYSTNVWAVVPDLLSSISAGSTAVGGFLLVTLVFQWAEKK